MSIIQDTVIMPDKYSTGVQSNQSLTNISTIEGVTIDTNHKRFIFTRENITALKNAGFAEDYDDGTAICFHNLLFESIYLQIAAPYLYIDHQLFKFKNCKIDSKEELLHSTQIRGGITTDNSNTNQIPWDKESLIFEYCDFTGTKCNCIIYSNMPITFDHCKAYEMGSDAFNVDNPYSKVLDCYAYNGGIRNTYNGDVDDAHADFIQSQGSMDKLFPDELGKTKVYVRRSRSDYFQYKNKKNNKYYLSNAALYMDTDTGNINVDVDYMWAVGGSYTYRAELSGSDKWVKGNGTHLYTGTCGYGGKHINTSFTEINYDVNTIETILAGSVWEEDNKINISITNYTNTPRKFKIRTNINDSEEFEIFACPQMQELWSSSAGVITFLEEKDWDTDFPIDKIYTVDSDKVKWVQVFDTTDGNEVLVRTEILSDESIIEEYTSVNDLFKAICDAIREKNGSTELIKHTDIPSMIRSIIINCNEHLSSITATKIKTEYTVNDTLNIDDITVTANYSDGSSSVVSGWISNVSDIDMASEGTKTLTISYTENEITKTASVDITVSAVTPEPEPSPVVPQTGTWS